MSKHTPWEWVKVEGEMKVTEWTLEGPTNVLCRYWYDEPPSAEAKIIATSRELLAALILATHELNAIRARDGAPQYIDWYHGRPLQIDACTHEWWDELTQQCLDAIKKATG